MRARSVLAIVTCLWLVGCRRETSTPPAPVAAPSTPQAAPQTGARGGTVDRRDETSDIIHNWRLPEVGKYTCPKGYRLDFIPQEKRTPGVLIWECRSTPDRSLPPKPVITRP